MRNPTEVQLRQFFSYKDIYVPILEVCRQLFLSDAFFYLQTCSYLGATIYSFYPFLWIILSFLTKADQLTRIESTYYSFFQIRGQVMHIRKRIIGHYHLKIPCTFSILELYHLSEDVHIMLEIRKFPP